MSDNYSTKLFHEYYALHGQTVDSDVKKHLEWFYNYYSLNYKKHFDKVEKNEAILEIGCNKGLLLNILHNENFTNLHGVDLSKEDIKNAKLLNSTFAENIVCEDANLFLKNKKSFYRVIILKAVLEHVKKDNIIPFLEAIKESLAEDGIVIIDVPNMDWLFAGHERYMDFTHEVGFTRESLSQIMISVFGNALIEKGIEPTGNNLKSKIKQLLKVLYLKIINSILKIIDPDGATMWWNTRSIICVSRKAK